MALIQGPAKGKSLFFLICSQLWSIYHKHLQLSKSMLNVQMFQKMELAVMVSFSGWSDLDFMLENNAMLGLLTQISRPKTLITSSLMDHQL